MRRLRLGKALTQETLGYAARLDRTYVSMLERGVKSPTLETMLSIANALGVTLTELAAAIEEEFDSDNAGHDAEGST